MEGRSRLRFGGEDALFESEDQSQWSDGVKDSVRKEDQREKMKRQV